MDLLITGIYLILISLISYLHFFNGLNSSIGDFIASIPNLFFVIGLIIIATIFPLISETFKNILFKITNFSFLLVYIFFYVSPINNVFILSKYLSKTFIYQNVNICSQNTKKSQAIYKDEFWYTLKLNKCDVVLLQEVINSSLYTNYLTEKTENMLHYKPYIINYGEFIIMSRYPITPIYNSNSQGFYAARLEIPSNPITIVNTHIWTPLEPRTPNIDPTLTTDIPAYQVRKQQTEELINYLSLNRYQPMLLIGDFNMLPTHPFISYLKKIGFYRIHASRIITPTFSNQIPIIEIDHTFTNMPQLVAYRTTILHSASDHAMQVISLNIQKTAGERARTSTGF